MSFSQHRARVRSLTFLRSLPMSSRIRRRKSSVCLPCWRNFRMETVGRTCSFFTAVLLLCVAVVKAQDPRVGLKPGFRDAGTVAHNLEHVWTLPKPDGFFDPKSPAGPPAPPDRPDPPAGGAAAPAPEGNPATPPSQEAAGATDAAAAAANAARGAALNFANSDFAFTHDHLIIGNFHGFNTYNVEDHKKARLVVSVVCPGGQGDVSVYGNLL